VRTSSYNTLLRKLRVSRLSPCTALFYVDLHGVRHFNLNGDPATVDQVIAAVSQAIEQWAGSSAIGLRLWSNEFVAAKAIDHPQAAIEEAQALREMLLSLRLPKPAGHWTPAVSIGVACGRPDGHWAQLLRQAAQACDAAKRRGINQIVFGTHAGRDSPNRLISTDHVDRFRGALASGALTLFAQPIIDIRLGKARLAKAEFLIRFLKDDGSLEPPEPGMIESLEKFGAISELDRYSCSFILAWLEENAAAMRRLESVSINLSARTMVDGAFMGKLFDDVRGARLPPGALSFEITETSAVEHLDVAAEVIAELRGLGCRFSLDDFGSGLCSFGYLQSLAVDEVKIDGRFIRDIARDKPCREIVGAIREVAHATGKKTTAEFVDTPSKLEILREIGVDYAQGYLFHPPIPPEQLLGLLGLRHSAH
jgi:EAL domain-containing protein (putative c-di-GMP-specific phosphodiesterase class I)/GGDEF domain-containing protein